MSTNVTGQKETAVNFVCSINFLKENSSGNVAPTLEYKPTEEDEITTDMLNSSIPRFPHFQIYKF